MPQYWSSFLKKIHCIFRHIRGGGQTRYDICHIFFLKASLNILPFFTLFCYLLSFFWQKCFDSFILDIVSNLLGKPELSCHYGTSLLALITQSRSEGRAKLFYKWGECDHCSLHTRPHGIRLYWHPTIYPAHSNDDILWPMKVESYELLSLKSSGVREQWNVTIL